MAFRISDKAHQSYHLADGKRVPSASTISGVMDKPHLVKWANNLGLNGIDSSKYVDSLANAGTLAHYLVGQNLEARKPEQSYIDEFSKVDLDRAMTSYKKYLEWQGPRLIAPIWVEKQLVSEKYRFGGTLDALLEIDGVVTLVDIKTCKGLYGATDEKWCQVAGYWLLATENGIEPTECAILRLGRDENEGFEFVKMPKPEIQRQRFLHCLDLYNDNRMLGTKEREE